MSEKERYLGDPLPKKSLESIRARLGTHSEESTHRSIKVLEIKDAISLSDDPVIRAKLEAKRTEYQARIDENKDASWAQIKSASYGIAILDWLLKEGAAQRIETQQYVQKVAQLSYNIQIFRESDFNRAWVLIQTYADGTWKDHVQGGTGLN